MLYFFIEQMYKHFIFKFQINSWFSQKADVRVKNLNLQLAMSTVIGLGDLAEDEIIRKPLPLEALLEKISIHLTEDRPPVNITSPGPVPIDVDIGKLRVTRDVSGIFHIQPCDQSSNLESDMSIDVGSPPRKERDRDRELISLQLVMQQLKLDNESLRRQVVIVDKQAEAHR